MATVTEVTLYRCDNCSEVHDSHESAEECCDVYDQQSFKNIFCPICMRIADSLLQEIRIEMLNKCGHCSPIMSYDEKEAVEAELIRRNHS